MLGCRRSLFRLFICCLRKIGRGKPQPSVEHNARNSVDALGESRSTSATAWTRDMSRASSLNASGIFACTAPDQPTPLPGRNPLGALYEEEDKVEEEEEQLRLQVRADCMCACACRYCDLMWCHVSGSTFCGCISVVSWSGSLSVSCTVSWEPPSKPSGTSCLHFAAWENDRK